MAKANKNNVSTNRIQNWKPRVLIALPILLVALITLWVFIPSLRFPNPNLHDHDKSSTRQTAQRLLDSIKLPGDIVYNEVRDKGCDGRSAGFFEVSYTCGYIGQKFYQLSGSSPAQAVSNADEALTKAGLRKSSENSDGSHTYIFDSGTAQYRISLGYYQNNEKTNDSSLSLLINSEKLRKPFADSFYYGVSFEQTYYACTNASWLQAPCPAQPSPLLVP